MRISDWSSDVCSSDVFFLKCTDGQIVEIFDGLFLFRLDLLGQQDPELGELLAGILPRRHPNQMRDTDEIRRRDDGAGPEIRSEEHTSELQSLMRISYAVFCLKKKTTTEIEKN